MSGITLNLSNSFINDERYVGHALVQPTLRCLKIMTANNDRLANCVTRSFAFLMLFFSLISFIPGLLCKSIHYLIAGPVAPIPTALNNTVHQSVTWNTPPQQPASIVAPPITTPQLNLASFVGENRSLQEEAEKLNSLQSFASAPILANYFSLLPAARYLVAGRYTYPTTFLWFLATKHQLTEKFELEFHSGINSERLNQAVQEAISLQEKILFAKILLKTLNNNGSVEALASIKPQIFNEINRCLKKGYGPGFDNDILRTHPTERKTEEIIQRAMNLWNDGYCDIKWSSFGYTPSSTHS